MRIYLVVLAALALAAVPAEAVTTYHTSPGSFATAAGGLVFSPPSYDFSEFTPGTLGMTVIDVGGSGVTFTSSAGNLDITGGASLLGFPGSRIDITFAPDVRAFAMNFTILSGSSGVCVDATGPNVCDYNPFVTAPTTVFWGVVSDAALTGISLRAQLSGARPVITGFQSGVQASSEVPEGRSLLLMGTGLIMVGLLRRFRRDRPVKSAAAG
jgi:hypothetical protein